MDTFPFQIPLLVLFLQLPFPYHKAADNFFGLSLSLLFPSGQSCHAQVVLGGLQMPKDVN